ncbi:hypothetical protein ACQP25_44575 (plasmid) [Microtetraspora malaysiensis]|uniref:hypothetical protein n=1 Tax=Microtetraspora malaysiensis TaxID=161358 RepID=UPI003D934DF3
MTATSEDRPAWVWGRPGDVVATCPGCHGGMFESARVLLCPRCDANFAQLPAPKPIDTAPRAEPGQAPAAEPTQLPPPPPVSPEQRHAELRRRVRFNRRRGGDTAGDTGGKADPDGN